MEKNQLNVLSLFSGVGGFDLGLERAGFKTIFQCEIDDEARSVLDRNFPNVPKWADITSLTAKEILNHEKGIDVVAWGSPCQDMSSAGLRAGLNGSKSSLFYEGLRIINELRKETNGKYPRISIWENVAGALTSNRGLDFRSVIREMAAAGANQQEYAVLDSARFGLPQIRRRVFLLSVFDHDLASRYPESLLSFSESDEWNHKKDNAISEDPIIAFYKVHGKQSIPQINIAPTLLTGSSVCVASPSMRPRRLVSIEHERLMGWPDDWTKYLSDGKEISHQRRVRMCGNGVAAPVATWIGSRLKELI